MATLTQRFNQANYSPAGQPLKISNVTSPIVAVQAWGVVLRPGFRPRLPDSLKLHQTITVNDQILFADSRERPINNQPIICWFATETTYDLLIEIPAWYQSLSLRVFEVTDLPFFIGGSSSSPGGGSPTGTAGGVLAGTYPNPSFASDMATQAELDALAASVTTALAGKADSTDPRFSDSRTPTGTAGGVLAGTYPNPSFASDMATQAELDALAGTVATALAGKADQSTTYTKSEVDTAIANIVVNPVDLDLFLHAGAIANVGGRISDTAITAARNLILSLRSGGLWDDEDLLWTMAGDNLQARRICLSSPAAGKAVTLVNWLESDTSQAGGFDPGSGNSTKHAVLNYTPSDFMTSSQGSLIIYSHTESNSGFDIGASTADGTRALNLSARFSGSAFFDCFNNDTARLSTALSSSVGFIGATRTAANRADLYVNGSRVAFSTATNASLPPAFTLHGWGINNNTGSNNFFSSRRMSLIWIKKVGLSQSQMQACEAHYRTYAAAIGRTL